MNILTTSMSNSENGYYGHGTGVNQKGVNSILHNGLRCSHNAMEFTTIPLGIGGSISKEVIKLFDNWPHCNYQNIIIVSLPIVFNILDAPSLGTYNERYGAFCYIPSVEAQKKYDLTNSRYIMPEFILGCYNAKSKRFKYNVKYYEFLPEDEKEKLFDKVRENYVQIISEGCGIQEYKEIIEDLAGWTFPLSEDELILTKGKL